MSKTGASIVQGFTGGVTQSAPFLKTRPRPGRIDAICADKMHVMLGCWAMSSDLRNIGACKGAAEELFKCVRTAPVPASSNQDVTVQYHLAQLRKMQGHRPVNQKKYTKMK